MTTKIYTAQELHEMADTCDTFADMACDNAIDPDGAIELYENMRKAYLSYAAMIERCENVRRHFAMTKTEREMLDYILRGDAGKEKE